MLDIQLSPEIVPAANVPLVQGLMALVARTAAMGFMASERITRLDARTIAGWSVRFRSRSWHPGRPSTGALDAHRCR